MLIILIRCVALQKKTKKEGEGGGWLWFTMGHFDWPSPKKIENLGNHPLPTLLHKIEVKYFYIVFYMAM